MGITRKLAAPGLTAGLLLGGCSGDVNPIKAAYVGAGYGPKPVAAPDFVAGSRREGADYMPVGEDAPRRATRARSTEGQRSLEAELEGARSRNEARGRAAASAGRTAGRGAAPAPAPASAATPAE